MSEYILLTGCTGLLGRYLLRDLLLEGCRLAVVVRSTPNETARARVEEILQMWEAELGRSLPRPVCLEGDVCQENLGFDGETCAWITENCSSLLHSAASLTFHADGTGEPYDTNVGGTRNVLELCHETAIRNFHYVSTAYVCGLRDERVMEDDLDFGQSFRNDYEQTKLEAEQLVREADFDQVTIYRPAVIAGDSKTGYTNTYHGLYLYLKLMAVLVHNTTPAADGVRYTPVRLNMTGDEPRNVVPVDWVSSVMCHLLRNSETHGKTYHLAPEAPLTPREIISAGYTYFNSQGVEFCGRDDAGDQPISDMERNARDNIRMYKEYEESDPQFDLTNLNRAATHSPCPTIDDAMLHRYWKYGEADRWGKRRPSKAKAGPNVAAHLQSLVSQHPSRKDSETRIGLEVVGPWGGQWTLALQDRQVVACFAGMASDCDAVIELDSADFGRLTGHTRCTLRSVCECLRVTSGGDNGSVKDVIQLLFLGDRKSFASPLSFPAVTLAETDVDKAYAFSANGELEKPQ